jgi:hypothetical protein
LAIRNRELLAPDPEDQSQDLSREIEAMLFPPSNEHPSRLPEEPLDQE